MSEEEKLYQLQNVLFGVIEQIISRIGLLYQQVQLDVEPVHKVVSKGKFAFPVKLIYETKLVNLDTISNLTTPLATAKIPLRKALFSSIPPRTFAPYDIGNNRSARFCSTRIRCYSVGNYDKARNPTRVC